MSTLIAPHKPIALRIVQPDPLVEKSGCMWCPLLAMNKEFDEVAADYQLDADKIRGALKEPHTIKTCNVSEPWDEVDILLVGEAPGAVEDKDGLPFLGQSGSLLRRTLEEVFKGQDIRTGFANTVCCRPPMNRDPRQAEIRACTPELLRQVRARKPKVIVPLGNFSLSLFTGRTGITAVCGKLMRCTLEEFKDIKIVPCVHPAYILHADHEFERFVEAIDFAGRVLTGDYEEMAGEGQYYVLDQADDVINLMAAFRHDKIKVAFDTETGSLSAFQTKYPKLLCLSFSNEEGVGYTVPWDHVDGPWSLDVPEPTLANVPAEIVPDRPVRRVGPAYKAWALINEKAREIVLEKAVKAWEVRMDKAMDERPRVAAALVGFFADPEVPKVAQNGKFDRQHIRVSLGVDVAGEVTDTMLRHLTIDDRRGMHGLEVLSFVYTGMGGYHYGLDQYIRKHPAADPARGGSYANIPGDKLFLYASQDSDSTLRVDNELIADSEYQANPRWHVLADTFLPELSRTLADMEFDGVQVDLNAVKMMEEDLRGRRDTVSKDMRKLPQVRQFIADQIAAGKTGKRKKDAFDFNPGSDPQLRNILFNYCGCRPIELTDGGFKRMVSRHARLKKADPELSFTSMIEKAISAKEWDLFSVKADVLHEYDRKGTDLASTILKYREFNKLLTTYVEPIYDRLDSEGRVHGTFLIGGAITARLASKEPNLQNLPPYAKRAFISRFGEFGLILSADFSQIELRFACSIFNEPKMIQAYMDGADLHTLTALALSGLTAASYAALPGDQKKKWRVRAKRINFGIVYGLGAPGIVNTLRKDGVFITLDEAVVLRDRFKATYVHLIAGMADLETSVRQLGYVEAFTGYRRRLPEVFNSDESIVARALRQAINFPVQHGAGFTTLIALCLIARRLKAAGCESRPILTVHDQIGVDTTRDEISFVAKMMQDVMQDVPSLSDEVLPGLDWSFLKVPILADFEAGVNWEHVAGFDPQAVYAETGSDAPLFVETDEGPQPRMAMSSSELFEAVDFKAKKAA